VLAGRLCTLATSMSGWRAVFFIESAAIVPFVVFAFVSRPLHLTGSRKTGPGGPWVCRALCGVACHSLLFSAEAVSSSVQLLIAVNRSNVEWLHECQGI
jgi:hypothetical protein